jgi:hypothetical protein
MVQVMGELELMQIMFFRTMLWLLEYTVLLLLVGDWELLQILLIGAGLWLLEYAVHIQLMGDWELFRSSWFCWPEWGSSCSNPKFWSFEKIKYFNLHFK